VASPDHPHADIDRRLEEWRQGDCVRGEHWFLSRAAPDRPLTTQSQEGCDPETGNTEGEVPGFVVLTQTCDLVRSCVNRPYVEIAPLDVLSEGAWRSAQRGRQPRFAIVPALAEERLVADLDRVMTVEKAVVARWERVQGCRDDDEVRAFARALARKRSRTAFPDDFVDLLKPLQQRIVEKHDKQSDEGRALRSLREIRVRAAPSWDAGEVEILFFFIREDEHWDFEGIPWVDLLEAWLGRVVPTGRYKTVDGLVQTLDELTARDYVESDLLDLGFLSERPE